jgi:signal transduction histidine kinase
MKRTTLALLACIAPPIGAQARVHTLALWERYWALITAVVVVLMLVKLALIVLLLLERRQRLRAQTIVEQQLSYVAHISRVATVGELAATLAHELRQPLAAIRYNADTALRLMSRPDANPAEVKELVAEISTHDARAADVIDRVVALLRHEERRADRVDLNEVCQSVRRLLHSVAATRRATVDLVLDPALPTIAGDSVQLQQVVLNLMLNALEALSQADGARTVVVETRACAGGVELSVRDNGPGIAPTVADRLFEPFFSTKTDGLGMGLVIVRSIIERHGGHVDAEQPPSGGAVFRVVLPLQAAHRAPSYADVRGTATVT